MSVTGIIRPGVYYLKVWHRSSGRRQGKTYYYLVESARVGGKPRIVSQRYLGPAEEIDGPARRGRPGRAGPLPAPGVWRPGRGVGDAGAAGVAEIIDEVAGRGGRTPRSVGTYMALACANRVLAPCSKLAFADWWATTAGDPA